MNCEHPKETCDVTYDIQERIRSGVAEFRLVGHYHCNVCKHEWIQRGDWQIDVK